VLCHVGGHNGRHDGLAQSLLQLDIGVCLEIDNGGCNSVVRHLEHTILIIQSGMQCCPKADVIASCEHCWSSQLAQGSARDRNRHASIDKKGRFV